MAINGKKFISAFGPKNKVRIDMDGQETRTHQSGKDECDINKLMEKYVKTGVLDHQKEHGENYGFATSIDLLEALTTVKTAENMFNALPAKIRTKFDNNPGEFLDFVQDPANEAELIELGLATFKPPATPELTTTQKAEKAQAAETPPPPEAPAAPA